MIDHMKPIGSRWRELRVDKDLDRDLVASALRINPKSLTNIESNQPRAVVSERLARRAARFFGVELAELVEQQDQSVDDGAAA